jgi:transcriptional regulator with XRE-family HTH domain
VCFPKNHYTARIQTLSSEKCPIPVGGGKIIDERTKEEQLEALLETPFIEMSKASGIGVSSISRFFNGDRELGLKNVQRLAGCFGITVDDLLRLIDTFRRSPRRPKRRKGRTESVLASLNPRQFYDFENRPLRYCGCGCGYVVNQRSEFFAGHSHRVASLFHQVDKGTLLESNLPASLRGLYIAYRAYPVLSLPELSKGIRDGRIKPDELL